MSETRALDHEPDRLQPIPAQQYSQLLFRTTNSQAITGNSTGIASTGTGQAIKPSQTYHQVSLGQIQRGQVLTGAGQAGQAAAMTVPTMYQSHTQPGGLTRNVVTLTGKHLHQFLHRQTHFGIY